MFCLLTAASIATIPGGAHEPRAAGPSLDEESSQLTAVGNPSEIAVLPPGTTGLSLRLTLKPGHYVVFCNLHVEDLLHYQKGMHTDFTVT